MPSRHYALLDQSVRGIAANWPLQRPTTAMPSKEYKRYNAATAQLMRDVEASVPKGKEAADQPAPFGVRIMFRICHIAALLAKQEGTAVNELAYLMYKERSFEIIDSIASLSTPIADMTEEQLGLRPTNTPVTDEYLPMWNLRSGYLDVPDFAELVSRVEESIGPSDPSAMCPAHKAKILKPLFRSVISICERDRNLFDRSLR